MVEEISGESLSPKIVLKTLSDRSISFDLEPSIATVGDVRQRLSLKEAIDVKDIVLISEGVVLQDDHLISTIPSSVHPSTQIVTTTIHWFYMEPTALALDPIESAKDWDAKNRLRCFKGLYLVSRRQFASAAPLLVDCLATFQDTSFLPFKQLVKYAVVAAALVFDRPSLDKKVIKLPEVLEVIDELPYLKTLTQSFYFCNYGAFFQTLAVTEESLKDDWLLANQVPYIVKEMRIRAYAQMLQSYRSLSLAFMAQHFGVTVGFIDKELCRFIAAGRLNCVIDKVAGVVLTNPPEPRNNEFQAMLKNGDALLNKIQKLSRVISQ